VNARLRLVLWAFCAITALAAVLIVLAGRDGGGASSAAPSSAGYEGALRPPGIPVRDFALRDAQGRETRLAALRGRPVLLTFLYSTCRTACPLTAQQIRGALDQLGTDTPVLAVSVDPRQDTPARARAFLVKQRVDGRMRFLLGSLAQLAPVWRAYAIQAQSVRADHSAYVFVLDRDGRRCVSWPTQQLTPEGLAHDLRVLLARGGRCVPA